VLLDLDFGLPFHVLHDTRALDLALQPPEHEAKALADVEPLEDLVLVLDPKIHVRRREVGEPPGVDHVHLEDLRNLIRDALHQLRQRLRRGDEARHQLLGFNRIGDRLSRAADPGERVRVALLHAFDDDAA
jgi:hypothetical protein